MGRYAKGSEEKIGKRAGYGQRTRSEIGLRFLQVLARALSDFLHSSSGVPGSTLVQPFVAGRSAEICGGAPFSLQAAQLRARRIGPAEAPWPCTRNCQRLCVRDAFLDGNDGRVVRPVEFAMEIIVPDWPQTCPGQ